MTPTYMTVHEFSAHARLSEATVRRLCERHQLHFIQPGGPGTKILIRADTLDSGYTSPPPAIPKPARRRRRGGWRD